MRVEDSTAYRCSRNGTVESVRLGAIFRIPIAEYERLAPALIPGRGGSGQGSRRRVVADLNEQLR